MRKRKNQLNASNEVEMDVLENEMNETSAEVEFEEELEIDLSESKINLEFDELEDVTEVIDTDEKEDDISDDIELELLKEELDVDVDLSKDTVVDIEDQNDDDFSETAEDLDSDEAEGEQDEVNVRTELPQSNLDFTSINPSITNPVKRFGDAGLLSIIYSKNGTRLSLSKDLNEELNEPATVQFGFIGSELIVGEELGEEFTDYSLKKQGAKQIVYCKELIEQMKEFFELDFSTRTSVTFSDANYEILNGRIIARIQIS